MIPHVQATALDQHWPVEQVLAWARTLPGASVLDSCGQDLTAIHWNPDAELILERAEGDSLAKLQAFLAEAPTDGSAEKADEASSPHQCPTLVMVSYDFVDALLPGALPPAQKPSIFPALVARRYQDSLVYSAAKGWVWYTRADTQDSNAAQAICDGIASATPPAAFPGVPAVRALWSRADYDAAYQRVRQCLYEGTFYQANLTQRFRADLVFPLDPWALYMRLRTASPAPFSALMHCGADRWLVSSSPERLVSVSPGGKIETWPIKGTRPRTDDPSQDSAARAALLASTKDRAELTMIVDLLRNDLSRICVPGSVKVPEMFRVESFAQVHHLVSRIIGQLRDQVSFTDLLRALMPGGSITGAPKLRVMQELRKIEPWERGPYTGSMFVLGHDGSIDSNILIRTLEVTPQSVEFGVGGGIVWDSTESAEYLECLDKAQGMLRALGARVLNQGT